MKELWTWVSSELGTREDQRSTEGHAQGQVESAAEVRRNRNRNAVYLNSPQQDGVENQC